MADPDKLPKDEQEDLLRSRFKTRRMMAMICLGMNIFWGTMIMMAVMMVPDSATALKDVTTLLGSVLTVNTLVIVAYMGAATVEHVKANGGGS